MTLKDKTVLITGASRGIGKAIAEKFLQNGYQVHGTFFASKDKILELQKQYGKNKVIIYGPYDFTNTNETEKLIEKLTGIEFDAVVCNVGTFSENDDFLNFNLKEFNKVMNCNLYTTLLLGIKLQNNIKNGGTITIMSSNDAYSGAFASISYSLSKAALLSLMKSLCVNYGRRNIRVNSVAPGSISTDMSTPEQEYDAPKFTPISRIGQPHEVAEVIYFLASPNSSFINGENITIDGGYSNISVLLQGESQRIRNFEGYQCEYDLHDTMNKGDHVMILTPCPYYNYIDTPEEHKIADQIAASTKRGAIVDEILIVDEEKETYMRENPLVHEHARSLSPLGSLHIVRKKDVIKYCPESYRAMGGGFGIFNNKIAFIDAYESQQYTGYTVKNEEWIKPLSIAFKDIAKHINNGEIKSLKLLPEKTDNQIKKPAGYKHAYYLYDKMKKGDELIHLSPCLSYTYIDNPEEQELLNRSRAASKRGANIYELLIVDENREKELQKSPIVKEYYKSTKATGGLYLIKKKDVMKHCPDDYKLIGAGYGIFNKKLAFIDSYESNDCIGYLVDDKLLVKPLVTSFDNIIANIKNGKIKPLKISTD